MAGSKQSIHNLIHASKLWQTCVCYWKQNLHNLTTNVQMNQTYWHLPPWHRYPNIKTRKSTQHHVLTRLDWTVPILWQLSRLTKRNSDQPCREHHYKSRLKCLYLVTELILPSLTADNNYYRFYTTSAHSISAICRRWSKPSVTKKWPLCTTIQGIWLFVHNNTENSTLCDRGLRRVKKWGSEGREREKRVSEEKVMRAEGGGSEKERINVRTRACVWEFRRMRARVSGEGECI